MLIRGSHAKSEVTDQNLGAFWGAAGPEEGSVFLFLGGVSGADCAEALHLHHLQEETNARGPM